MAFVRVRTAGLGDPLHEFDVPERELRSRPEKYRVVDPEPVAESRPVLYVQASVPVARKSGGNTKKGRP